MAGTAVEVTAHEDGAEGLIVEKTSEGGGNIYVAGGNIIIPKGIELADYADTISFKTADRGIIEVLVQYAMKNGEWIKKNGRLFIWRQSLTPSE